MSSERRGVAKQRVTMIINGGQAAVDVHPMERLLDVLRNEMRLTGTKEGCGEGECGACSVILNGELVNSCLVPVLQAEGADICTIEGLSANGEMHPVQKSFLHRGGAQCGICTPGMIMASVKLLESNPHPQLQQVREALAGNLCRCTGYQKIFEAVLSAYAGAEGAASIEQHQRGETGL